MYSVVSKWRSASLPPGGAWEWNETFGPQERRDAKERVQALRMTLHCVNAKIVKGDSGYAKKWCREQNAK